MTHNRNIIQQTDAYKRSINNETPIQNIYWGEVISIIDDADGGRIKVRIPNLDNKTPNEDLPECYPMMSKFLHLFPKVGELVRVFIGHPKHPYSTRFWMSVITSQPHKIEYETVFTALSTTNQSSVAPEKAPSTYPNAIGIYPNIDDIALIGRKNTDIILRENDVEIRAGKHEDDNVLKLNKKNPASVRLTFEENSDKTEFISTNIVMADRIALISHDGIPKFKSNQLNSEDRNKIFDNGHPIARGDTLVEMLEIFRKAIINHIHGYDKLPSDKTDIIADLQKINLKNILQKNIVIN